MRARLAIADPPYLGRANRWYGDGRGAGRHRITHGRNGRKPDRHPDAAVWDDPQAHASLFAKLAEFDGWAYAGAPDSLPALLPYAPELSRLAVWHRPNAIPGGGRVITSWEFVLFFTPKDRRGRYTGPRVRDVLTSPVLPQGFLGSKPPAWTSWVLDLLGYQPGDEVADMFPGSGAVERAVKLYSETCNP